MAQLTQHEFLLRTNREYRDRVVAETILKMAQLVDALAVKNGLSFSHGRLVGLNEEEAAIVQLAQLDGEEVPVRESSPNHAPQSRVSESIVDSYVRPGGTEDSETVVDDEEISGADAGSPDSSENGEDASSDSEDAPKRRRRRSSEEEG